MQKTAYLYVCDTLSDWETGYLTAELNTNRFSKKGADEFKVKTVAISEAPIRTMGGITIVPDMTIKDISSAGAGVLILPGGETWLEPQQTGILNIAKEFLSNNILVVAICGATMGLAKAGCLEERAHTSNNLAYLKSVCPNYTGESFYKEEPAVIDNCLITASGTAPLQFAYLAIKHLGIYSEATLDAWYNLHLTHEDKYFYALMKSMEE